MLKNAIYTVTLHLLCLLMLTAQAIAMEQNYQQVNQSRTILELSLPQTRSTAGYWVDLLAPLTGMCAFASFAGSVLFEVLCFDDDVCSSDICSRGPIAFGVYGVVWFLPTAYIAVNKIINRIKDDKLHAGYVKRLKPSTVPTGCSRPKVKVSFEFVHGMEDALKAHNAEKVKGLWFAPGMVQLTAQYEPTVYQERLLMALWALKKKNIPKDLAKHIVAYCPFMLRSQRVFDALIDQVPAHRLPYLISTRPLTWLQKHYHNCKEKEHKERFAHRMAKAMACMELATKSDVVARFTDKVDVLPDKQELLDTMYSRHKKAIETPVAQPGFFKRLLGS